MSVAARSSALIPLRVLFLRSTREDYLAFTWRHFAFGIIVVWLVGMGRYWDNPRVGLAQHLGLGSVVYVFVLAALLWVVGLPFGDAGWRYIRVLTMVVLSAPPAAIYAIPVEQWSSFETARSINTWFLAIVALWRMLIWGRFVWVMCPTDPVGRIMTILMPVTIILVSLVALNLENAVFEIMAGLHDQDRPKPTTVDGAYFLLFALTFISIYLLLPIVGITYLICAVAHVRERFSQRTRQPG